MLRHTVRRCAQALTRDAAGRARAQTRIGAAAAIGAPDSVKGEALICFCVLKPGANKHVDLAGELKKKVATELGKALALRDVLFAADLPKTRNAKMPRRLICVAYVGEKLGDILTFENPASTEEIRRMGRGD